MIIQTSYPPSNVSAGDIIKTSSGSCYSYVGNFVNYAPTPGYIVTNQNLFTATTTTTYGTCEECQAVTPTTLPYTLWSGKGEFSVNCPVCQLTNFGVNLNFYTSSAVTSIQTGVYIYENTGLTTPISVTYVEYGTKIYSVDKTGMITEFCTLNGNC